MMKYLLGPLFALTLLPIAARADIVLVDTSEAAFNLTTMLSNGFGGQNQGVQVDFANEAALTNIARAGTGDVLVSEDAGFLNQLSNGGMVVRGSVVMFAVDPLALISAGPGTGGAAGFATPLPLPELANPGMLAVVNNGGLLVTQQTAQALQSLDPDGRIAAAAVSGASPEAVMQMVQGGQAKYGLVRLSSALRDPRLAVIAYVPLTAYQPSGYYIATVNRLQRKPETARFYGYMTSSAIAGPLRAQGLVPAAAGFAAPLPGPASPDAEMGAETQ